MDAEAEAAESWACSWAGTPTGSLAQTGAEEGSWSNSRGHWILSSSSCSSVANATAREAEWKAMMKLSPEGGEGAWVGE
ncbi:MAG: hypothetical protein WDW38_010232 [Sanguina aurantia]